jgi:hypothetical protein
MTNEIVVENTVMNPHPKPDVTPQASDLHREAQPFSFQSVYRTADLEPLFAWWFAEMEHVIPDLVASKLKNSKAKKNGITVKSAYTMEEACEAVGGKWKLFESLLQELLRDSLKEKSWPREPMYTDTLEIIEDSNLVTLRCRVYFMPMATFVKNVDELRIDVPKHSAEDVDKRLADQIEVIKAQKSMEHEKHNPFTSTASVVEEGDIAVCTIRPRIDGKPWTVGEITNNKMRVIQGGCHPDELRLQLLGKSVGQHLITFVLNDKFGDMTGKVVEANVIIHSILTYKLPDWNDDLAKQCGHETIQSYEDSIREQVVRGLTQNWESKASHEAVQNLIECCEFEPIPSEWIMAKANEKINQQVSRFGNDIKKMCEAYQVKTQEDLINRISLLCTTEAYSVIALFTYGVTHNIERSKDEGLGNFSSYLQKCVHQLLDSVQIKESVDGQHQTVV